MKRFLNHLRYKSSLKKTQDGTEKTKFLAAMMEGNQKIGANVKILEVEKRVL